MATLIFNDFRCAAVCCAMVCLTPLVLAQTQRPPDVGANWPMYNRDLGGTRFSPLRQINATNVGTLHQAWSYNLGKAVGNQAGSEFTPIVVNGVLYLDTFHQVTALDAASGKEIWRYELKEGAPSKRGVAYWPGDRNNPPRIIFTTGSKMMALNANTGKIDPGFGNEGTVEMTVPYNSAPLVYKNLLIVGANTPEAPAKGPAGDTRAYDARTGKKLWEFHSVPRPGEFGHDTWEGDSARNRSGVNNWGFSLTLDAERGILYTVFGGPNTNFWGGDRKGQDLFANCIVAIDAQTGKMKWYFQVVHHDIWDFDLPAPPALMDVTVNGKTMPILAQTAKTGYMYILNRVTGKPVFGINERPVLPSKVPGEQSSPTQPVPLKPPPLARMSYGPEEIVSADDTNADHAKFCLELQSRSGGFYNEGPFTPYLYRGAGAKPHSTIIFPGAIGGVNWGGAAADTGLGYFFVNSNDEASIGWVEKKPEGSKVLFDRNSVVGPMSRFHWSEGDPRIGNIPHSGEHAWPCQKPPWGRLIAVDAHTGDFAWQVPLGITDELPVSKRNTGRLNLGGPIATAGGLVFIGATNDRRFRAFNSKTGRELWSAKLDASAHAVPITYEGKNGKQYVAIVAGGNGTLDDATPGVEALDVYTLP
jgi:quinoprotein glucose dehydrogenase